MREVSQEWSDMYSNDEFTAEGNVRVYGDWGYVGIDSVSITYNDTDLSDLTQPLIAENSQPRNKKKNYITLERNAWLLDGTFDYIENMEDKDIVASVMSGSNRDFFGLQMIIECNTSNTPTNAITIKFDNDFATEFTVVRGSTSVTVQGTSGYNVVMLPDNEETTNTIKIIINKWSLPYRRIKVSEIINGVRLHYDKSVLSQVNFNSNVDVLSGALPSNVVSLNILDVENMYDTEQGIYNNILPQINWKVDVGHIINDAWEWVRLNKTYKLTEVMRPQNGITATFYLSGWISRITGKFPAEIQSSPDGEVDPYYWETWSDLLFNISKLTGVKIDINQAYKVDSTSAGYATQRTFRAEIELLEWLQTVANGALSVIKETERGILIDSLVDGNIDFFEKESVAKFQFNEAYSYPEIEVFPKIKDVSITGFNPANNNIQYTYLTTYNSNADVSQTATNERIRFYDGVIASSQSFIPEEYVPKYTLWVYKFINEAKRITGNSRINPVLELLDLVEVETKSGQLIKGYIVGLDIKFTGAFRGTYTVYAPKGQNEV